MNPSADSLSPSRLAFGLPLDPARLLRARQRIRDYLHEHGVSGRTIEDVVLALEEAMTNAVRHSGDVGELDVRISFEGTDLRAEVSDHGRGFDISAFDPTRLPDPLAPGGRGLYLISQLMDDLELAVNGGLLVRMLRRGVYLKALPDAVHTAIPTGPDLDSDEGYRTKRERSLLEEIDEGFVALDWQYRLTYINRVALSIYGLSPGQVFGRTLWELFPHIMDTPQASAFVDAMELGRPAIVEYESPLFGRFLEYRIYPTRSGLSYYVRDIEERKRKELAHDESRRRVELLARTTSRLLSAADPQSTIEALCHDVMDELGWDVFFNYLADDEAGCLRLNAYGGIDEEEAQLLARLDYGVAVGGCGPLEAQRIVVEDVQHSDDVRAEIVRAYGVQAYAAHPLIVREKVLGTLSFGSRRREAFTQDELSLMATVADHVAVAIDRQNTEKALRWELDERVRAQAMIARRQAHLAVLADLAGDFARLSRADDILQAVGARIGAHLNIASCYLDEVDEEQDTDTVERAWVRQDAPDLAGTYRLSAFFSPQLRSALRSGKTLTVGDTQDDQRVDAEAYKAVQIGAFVAVPFHQEGIWRYFFTVTDTKPHFWWDDEVELIEEVASRTFPRLLRAHSEDALARTAERLDLAQRAAGAGTWDWDIASGKLEWSPLFYEILGIHPDLPPSFDAWNGVLHPEDQQAANDRISQSLRDRTQLDSEYRIVANGELRWIRALGKGIYDDEGRPLRMTGICLDITERKRAREKEERLLALMDHNPTLLFLKDEAGRYVYVNETYKQHFIPVEDWYGRTDFDFWPQESAELFRSHDLAVLQSGQTRQFLEDSTDRNGRRFCWLSYKFPFTDAQNNRYVGGTAIDATARVQAEEELAVLLREQTQIASTLQQNFIHPLPQIPKVDIAVVEGTAEASELVGGDFHDAFVEKDLLWLLVGDVQGKGIRAAGLTETVCSSIRSLAHVRALPSWVLDQLNDVLVADGIEQFTTLALAALNLTTGRLTLASAGHCPPVLLRSSGPRLLSSPPGLPLGIFETRYGQRSFTLRPGEGLVLYTDGLTEARRDGEIFGEQRLLQVLTGLTQASAAEVCEALNLAVVEYADRLQDDMRILALRWQ